MAGDSKERDLLIGTEVAGRYRVIRLIGRGGMGSIYEVHHNRLDRSFAMKTLSSDVAQDSESVARFRREADVIAKLRHPHIVEIVDWDELEDGTPCLIMEYLRGEDLGQRIRNSGPLPWNVVAQIGDQVLSALVVAHQAGIIHRDLKPQNIFLAGDDSNEERAKLLDFGVSKISGVQSLTTESRLIGTPSYMSPEQAEGQQDTVGEPTDVWAMGAILYEMATGRAAFEGASLPAILYRICHGAPDRLLERRVDAPPAFVELVECALSRDPAKRITRIHTLRSSLRRALIGQRGVAYAESLRMATPPAGIPITIALDPTLSSGDLTPPVDLNTTLSKTAAESFGARAVASPVAATRRARTTRLVAGGLAIATIAVIAFFVLRGGAPDVVATIDARAAAPDAAIRIVEPPPDAVARAKVKHAISSQPPDARVVRESDHVVVGSTPFVLEVEPGSSAVEYVVEKQGFARERIRIIGGELDRQVEVTLRPDKKVKPPELPKTPPDPKVVVPKQPPETPKTPVPCRKKGEPPNPFDKKPPCPE